MFPRKQEFDSNPTGSGFWLFSGGQTSKSHYVRGRKAEELGHPKVSHCFSSDGDWHQVNDKGWRKSGGEFESTNSCLEHCGTALDALEVTSYPRTVDSRSNLFLRLKSSHGPHSHPPLLETRSGIRSGQQENFGWPKFASLRS